MRDGHPTTISEASAENDSAAGEPRLIRGVGLAGATTLNMIDMIGVGPFITIPLIVAAMGVPQAMIAVLRARRPDMPRPFRMWLYPVPAVLAFAGFVYVLLMRPNFQKEVRLAFVLIAAGLAVYLLRARARGEWPFAGARGGETA